MNYCCPWLRKLNLNILSKFMSNLSCMIKFDNPSTKNNNKKRLSRWLSAKESAWQCRKCRRCLFNPWVRKILWRRKWQPTPVFLPVKSHDGGPSWSTVHRVAKSRKGRSMHALSKHHFLLWIPRDLCLPSFQT